VSRRCAGMPATRDVWEQASERFDRLGPLCPRAWLCPRARLTSGRPKSDNSQGLKASDKIAAFSAAAVSAPLKKPERNQNDRRISMFWSP
jgi:hypothetical protein